MEERTKKVIEEFKEMTRKKCYSIDLIEEEPEILDNKIGGKPYLPIGEEYPKDKEGNYMALLLQINLKDIDLEGFPKSGILEIFTDRDANYPCQYAIKYLEDGKEYQKELPEVDLTRYIVNRGYKINLSEDYCYMPVDDYRFIKTVGKIIKQEYNEEIKGKPDLEEFFDDCEWYTDFNDMMDNPLITFGGYADFTQQDPRGYRIKDKDECLFKIDAIYGKGVSIGDLGILSVMISKTDLENNNFSNAVVDWDCM